jgi:MFS superfamily sulfate permease-like transporter
MHSRLSLGRDLAAALVVFLVALPLCLGIALASHAPLVSGIVSGIVGGVLVGALSGSHTAVSGPAAGLAVIVASGIATLGSYETFLASVVVCGAIQILFGLLRAGFLASLVPASVIRGMLASIGIIVILKQIPHALGRDDDYEGDESFWFLAGEQNTFTDIFEAFLSFSPGVVIVSITGIVLLWLWDQPWIKQKSWALWFPGPLAAVGAGVALNILFRQAAPGLAILPADGHLVAVPNLLSGDVTLPSPDFASLIRPEVWTIGLELALIASLESLLSLEAGDRIDPHRRTSPPDRELFAQGAGNVVAGLFGGLPMTAVIVRTSANVLAGGGSRYSAIGHGLLLAALVLAAPMVLNEIPLGSLAAILLTVGYKLSPLSLFRDMYRRGWSQFLPFATTVVVTVLTDLLTGVMVGIAAGLVSVILGTLRTAIVEVHDEGFWMIKFSRDVSFLHKHRLRTAFERVPNDVRLVVDAHDAGYLDADIQDAIERFTESAQLRGIHVRLIGFEGKLNATPMAAH